MPQTFLDNEQVVAAVNDLQEVMLELDGSVTVGMTGDGQPHLGSMLNLLMEVKQTIIMLKHQNLILLSFFDAVIKSLEDDISDAVLSDAVITMREMIREFKEQIAARPPKSKLAMPAKPSSIITPPGV